MRRLSPALAALLLLAAARAGAVEGFLYSRTVEVPDVEVAEVPESEGGRWIRVPLDLTALQHLAPDAEDLHVFGPAGNQVPRRVVYRLPRAGPSLANTTEEADCDHSRPGTAVCRLPLPAAEPVLRRLAIDLQGPGELVGYRLYEPRQARWQLLAEGTWRRAGSRSRHLLLDEPRELAGGMFRLELHGPAGETLPRLARVSTELAVPTVVFQATVPGRYTLAYGGLSQGETLRGAPPSDGRVLELLAGPERPDPPPALAAGAPRSASWGDRSFLASWTVIAPAARPRTLVRLEIPDLVYAGARPDLGDLRLAAGKREVPFFRWSPPEPVEVVEEREARPEPIPGRSQEETVEISLPASGLPLTELSLTSPARSFRRRFEVSYVFPSPIRARRRERPAVGRRSWTCSPEPPLPCREEVALPSPALSLLAVQLDESEEGEPLLLDLSVWRRRDVLFFVWPEEGPVRLLAGSGSLAPPSYELARLGPMLLTQPWQPAEVDLAAVLSPKIPWWNPWVRPSLLVVATVCLLLLLRRILPDV